MTKWKGGGSTTATQVMMMLIRCLLPTVVRKKMESNGMDEHE